MIRKSASYLLAFAAIGCAPQQAGNAPPPSAAPGAATEAIRPVVAHHQHLLSPALAARSAARSQLPAVDVPAELARVLAGRAAAWNDSLALARVYAPDAVVLDPESGRWLRGSTAASFMARLFARPYTITPVSVAVQGSAAHVAGYYTRPVEGRPWHFGQVLLALRKGDYGAWRVAAETATFPADATPSQVTADQLIAQMDAAGVRRAVVLSLGYSWGSPLAPPVDDEYGKVRAENDWTAREVARYPDRLVAFCGVNPLKEYAVREMERCSRDLHMRGLKLHFGNSGVNVLNPEHVARVREVFRAANRLGMPIVAHLWTRDPSYGAAHSRIFLEQILPEAPDVVVQVAHMTDAGPGYEADAAMAPLAEAVAAGDPRTRNLYFDVASNVTITSPDRELEQLVRRIRQIGPRRILWGSDGGWGGNPPLRQSWGAFHGMLPLTEAEFRIIAGNVAPYLR